MLITNLRSILKFGVLYLSIEVRPGLRLSSASGRMAGGPNYTPAGAYFNRRQIRDQHPLKPIVPVLRLISAHIHIFVVGPGLR